MNTLTTWLRHALPADKQKLAERVGTTVNYLSHLAAGPERYGREPKAELAARIEAHTTRMNRQTKGRLPIVLRTDLVSACRACPYAQQCLGARANGAEQPFAGEA